MAIEVLSNGSSSAGSESFSFTVDYDTAAQTIGLTCTGTGHAELTVAQTSDGTVLGATYADQYGTSAGPIAGAGSVDGGARPNAGESASPVTYTGSRIIALGPGAAGVDANGNPLSTRKVSPAVVGALSWVGNTPPGLGITLSWRPNFFGS